MLVDTQGLILAVKVHAANLADRVGARVLLDGLKDRFPRLAHVFAGRGYTGSLLDWIRQHLGWTTEIVPKPHNDAQTNWTLVDGLPVQVSKPKRGFHVQRQRWKVEQTFGLLLRFRRLARDYEGLPRSSEAMIQMASIHRFLVRLTPFRSTRA
ncbi:hypothetical protein KSX_04550 [Ktedonospora formicarum]|uniref:Transposase IS4-like domain-containing protein n=1 Tax=Ktedonospora formicarum TaxID=2778364 RepID=A0A8J3HX55_9CHLR|nr:hypothetical protein KSX_04550 [Ktedonospora formicarum]